MVVCPTYLQVEPRSLLFPDEETQTAAAYKTEIEVLEAVEFVIVERIPGKTRRDIASISPASADRPAPWSRIHYREGRTIESRLM